MKRPVPAIAGLIASVLATLAGLVLLGPTALEKWRARSAPATAAVSLDEGGHPELFGAAGLRPGRLEEIYAAIAPAMARLYAAADDPVVLAYPSWRRFNIAPYRSALHGAFFVNNYANEIAADAYGRYEDIDRIPAGGIIAKDSFGVTREGNVFAGPLVMMEKLASGASLDTGDWRYIRVSQEGGFAASVDAAGREALRACADCHNSAAAHDRLFFLPKEMRRHPAAHRRERR